MRAIALRVTRFVGIHEYPRAVRDDGVVVFGVSDTRGSRDPALDLARYLLRERDLACCVALAIVQLVRVLVRARRPARAIDGRVHARTPGRETEPGVRTRFRLRC